MFQECISILPNSLSGYVEDIINKNLYSTSYSVKEKSVIFYINKYKNKCIFYKKLNLEINKIKTEIEECKLRIIQILESIGLAPDTKEYSNILKLINDPTDQQKQNWQPINT